MARDADDETGPERTCVATRARRPVAELIRFVASPDGVLTPDIKGRLPGRGVWVSCSRAAVETAIRRGAFARALRRAVASPDDLPDLVEALLAADARQSLAMANKAGLVVAGFAKVEKALERGSARALLSARDGAEDGRRKLAQAAARGGRPVPILSPFASRELDLALGRENAIHAALIAGPASDAFLARCARLEMFRSGAPGVLGPDARGSAASCGPLPLEDD